MWKSSAGGEREGSALHGRRRQGQPRAAAYGYVLESEDGHVLDARGEAIGITTNNVAEYSALVAGLVKAVELGVDDWRSSPTPSCSSSRCVASTR